MRPVTRCSGGDGLTCREPTHHSVANVSLRWCGQASIGALELRPSGARQRPARRGRRSTAQPRPSRRKRRHHDHETCGTEAHQCCDPPRFETEQRNHSGRRHLPDGVVFRGGRDARFRGGYLGPVGRAGSTVTPPQFRTAQTLEEEKRHTVFYDAHFTVDVTKLVASIWLDGTMQIMDREDILLSDRLVPVYLREFPDDRRSANEVLASMVGMAKIHDRILTLADEHGLHVDGDEFSTLTVLSGGSMIGTMMAAMRRSGAELDIDQFRGEDVSKRPIWDNFVDDLTNDPVIEHSRTPVEAAPQWRPAKPFTHSMRFHVYTKPMGEMTFVSGEVALTVDNVETLSWETNVGVIRSENIAGKVQEMFDRLVVGASVVDSLTSAADACGITLAMAGDFLIVAYFNGEIIGQIAVGASRSSVELTPSCLHSPDRSDAVEEAWGEFCARIREIPDSGTI